MKQRRLVLAGLLATVLLQVTVLAAEYLNAVYPLWSGSEVRLATRPVDPRSLFRGNYARLRYDINRLPPADLEALGRLRHNEIVYVRLERAENGLHRYAGVSRTSPDQGLFIRGRSVAGSSRRTNGDNVLYGIDAWFAPKDKALALEHELAGGGVAVVMIAANGKAALKNIIVGQQGDNPAN